MKCPRCSSFNRDRAKFCNECGFDLRVAVPDRAADLRGSMPEELSQKILASRDRIPGSRRLVTIIFADIRPLVALLPFAPLRG